MLSRRAIPKESPPANQEVAALAAGPDKLSPSDAISDRTNPRDRPQDQSTSVPTRNSSRRVEDQATQTTLWLRRTDQWLLGFLLIALLALLIAFRWKVSGAGQTEIEIISQQPREYFYAIEINQASWVEWAQLDGIGEKLAKRIVEDRDQHGPFHSIDEIRRVRGFGPKLIEKLRPFLKCAFVANGAPKLTTSE